MITVTSVSTEKINSTFTLGDLDPDREDGVVFIRGFKVDSEGTQEPLVVEDYDEETAVAFELNFIKDGHYLLEGIFIPLYDDLVTFQAGETSYEGGQVYRALQETTGDGVADPAFWEPAEPFEVLEAENIVFASLDKILYPFTVIRSGDRSEDYALQCCGDCSKVEEFLDFATFRVLITGMIQADAREKFAKGEKMARKSDELAGC